jgi:iron-sulfur cluster assembly protein
MRGRCSVAGHGAAHVSTPSSTSQREEFGVLSLTDQAVSAIRGLTTRPGLAEETGLRIAPQDGDAGGLTLSLADGPQAGDQVIEESDVQVFLQPEAAAVLDDKALDAQINEDGEVSFVIQRQA